jgi:hypothetical protein
MVRKVIQESREKMDPPDHKVFKVFKAYRDPQAIRVQQGIRDLQGSRPIQAQLETRDLRE